MNNNMKLIALLIASGGLAGISAGASAAYWEDGDCTNSTPGPAPCIEYQDDNGAWWHFNGDGSHAGSWHGPNPNPATDNFLFEGETDLECGFPAPSITAQCKLSLLGQVRKFEASPGNWEIGIRVNGGGVSRGITDDPTCDTILLSGTPWYVGKNNQHTFNSNSGVTYSPGASNYIGAIGTIGFKVGSLPTISGHMHDITFSNNDPNRSYFEFDSDVMTRVFVDVSTGCHISGRLYVSDPEQDINIR